jgi:putative oxidoreductase
MINQYLFILGRILLGGYFLMSGFSHLKSLEGTAGYAASKKVPMPKVAVSVTGIMMLLGGAGVLLGIYTMWSILLLSVFLLCVSFQIHDFWNDTDPMQKMTNKINFTKNIALMGAILMLLAIPTPWVMALF